MATIKKRGDGLFVQIRRKGFPAQDRTFRAKAEAAGGTVRVQHGQWQWCLVGSERIGSPHT